MAILTVLLFAALNLASISYTLLHSTGLALKHGAIADLAVCYLKDVTPLVVDISTAAPLVVMQDLADIAAAPDLSVAREAVRNTQAAWDGKPVAVGR